MFFYPTGAPMGHNWQGMFLLFYYTTFAVCTLALKLINLLVLSYILTFNSLTGNVLKLLVIEFKDHIHSHGAPLEYRTTTSLLG